MSDFDYTQQNIAVPVLDQGWVMMTDRMGSDAKCVERARLSHNGVFRGWDKEEGLLKYLLRHEHKSVFQAGRLVLRTKLPIETVREIDRHRTLDMHGDLQCSTAEEPAEFVTVDPRRKFVNKNEASGRYIDLTTLGTRRIPYSRVGRKSKTNKQSTGTEALPTEMVDQFLAEDNALKDACEAHIRKWTDKDGPNLAYEVVRGVMNLDNYTIIELDGDLLWWMDFMRLRLAPGAKQEVREFAGVVADFFKANFPRIYELFEEYTLHAARVSRTQIRALRSLLLHVHSTLRIYEADGGPEAKDLVTLATEIGEANNLSGGELVEFVSLLTGEV